GARRRDLILGWLRQSGLPMTGQLLATKTNVSRQVIVQDISLLKAAGEPIIATSRGYLYVKENFAGRRIRQVIAVCHKPEETAAELYTLVDYGVTIVNVIVEHPVYGDLTGSLMLQNRFDVDEFLQEMERTSASLLSRLTDGVHLHTIEADSQEQLDKAVEALKRIGILLEN
ncbi:MAG TPA: transcription repressor NadR, partial [Bacilli bacterium]